MRVKAMLASDGELPCGGEWVAEPKMDGWRACIEVKAGAVTVWSRHGTNLTQRFPELAELGKGPDCVLDGELVVYGLDGLPDFYALGQPPSVTRKAHLAVFDVLSLDGQRITAEPYEQRRARLEAFDLPDVAHPVVTGDVHAMWDATAQMGLEGVVAKRLDSRYRSVRSKAWIRGKHWTVSTYPVCGYVPTPSGWLSALFVDCGQSVMKVELGLHRAAELIEALVDVPSRRRHGVVWCAPTVSALIRHHGRCEQPRDAQLLGRSG